MNTKRIKKRLRKKFGDGMRFLNDESDIISLVLPMVPEFLERMGYPQLLPEVAGLLRDTKNIHTFVAFSDGKAVGFATYTVEYMPLNSSLHVWHFFVKRQYRHLSHMFYDLSKLLMEEMDVDNLSFTGVNPRHAAYMARECKKLGIDMKLAGYFYRSFHNVEKRKYKASAKKLSKLCRSTQGRES